MGFLPCPISSARSAYAISFDYWPLEYVTSFRSITLEWHVCPGRRSKYNNTSSCPSCTSRLQRPLSCTSRYQQQPVLHQRPPSCTSGTSVLFPTPQTPAATFLHQQTPATTSPEPATTYPTNTSLVPAVQTCSSDLIMFQRLPSGRSDCSPYASPIYDSP